MYVCLYEHAQHTDLVFYFQLVRLCQNVKVTLRCGRWCGYC